MSTENWAGLLARFQGHRAAVRWGWSGSSQHQVNVSPPEGAIRYSLWGRDLGPPLQPGTVLSSQGVPAFRQVLFVAGVVPSRVREADTPTVS